MLAYNSWFWFWAQIWKMGQSQICRLFYLIVFRQSRRWFAYRGKSSICSVMITMRRIDFFFCEEQARNPERLPMEFLAPVRSASTSVNMPKTFLRPESIFLTNGCDGNDLLIWSATFHPSRERHKLAIVWCFYDQREDFWKISRKKPLASQWYKVSCRKREDQVVKVALPCQTTEISPSA